MIIILISIYGFDKKGTIAANVNIVFASAPMHFIAFKPSFFDWFINNDLRGLLYENMINILISIYGVDRKGTIAANVNIVHISPNALYCIYAIIFGLIY